MKASVRFGLLGLFAFVAAAFATAQFVDVAQAQPAGTTFTKACTQGGVPIGQTSAANVAAGSTVNCTLTLNFPAVAGPAGPITVTLSGGTFMASSGAAGADVTGVTVNPNNIVITCFGGTCEGTVTVTETITAGTVGGPLSEAVTVGGVTFAAPTPFTITIVAAQFVTTATLVSCRLGSSTGAVQVTFVPGDVVVCEVDLDDNEAAPNNEFVSSGLVTVTFAGGTTITGVGIGSAVGPSATFRCPDGTATGPNLCDRVFVQFTATTTAILGPVSFTIAYDPDIDAQNTSLVQTFLGFTVIQPVAAFVQPEISIVCPAALNPGVTAALPALVPGPIGPTLGAPLAIGVLPAALVCQVVVTPTTGGAPGTIEITTLTGTLIDASGRLTTNLRIACGDPSAIVFVPGAVINVNNCLGVQFAVTNLGVGITDLRARYEPSTAAALAGIQERETAGNVAFVAPAVTVSLLLSPNPVTVGQTGTATARFNRTVLACGVGIFCVDPTTGAPILFNAGSVLNGNVLFTIDNSAIARWAAAQPTATAPAPTATAGFVTTANQTIVRCGFFATTGFPAAAIGFQQPSLQFGLAQFFGGCESVSATYVGVQQGVANITATFISDLPAGPTNFGIVTPFLAGQFSGATGATQTRALEVIGAAPSGAIQLVRGCNNVTPTVTETATAYAARVSPSGALQAIWEHQAATNTFRGFSPQAGAPNDLPGVTRLRPVFVCVSTAATLDQPAA